MFMEIKIENLNFNELVNLYEAMQEFVEFLESEEDTEVEKRK